MEAILWEELIYSLRTRNAQLLQVWLEIMTKIFKCWKSRVEYFLPGIELPFKNPKYQIQLEEKPILEAILYRFAILKSKFVYQAGSRRNRNSKF